ncbi:MAG: methylated-DNA--protein-cysteine methyltransferase [bacterium]|nr:MAG: methylated-DNA--protein-cysteine methyltransferase [bacterium]
MDVYGNIFKTAFGWAAVVFNGDGAVLKFFLPTGKTDAENFIFINGLRKRKPLLQVETKVKKYFDGKRVNFEDTVVCIYKGTVFEGLIYKKLREVPYGGVISYSRLAGKAGSPRGARAAGQVVAKNQLPLIVPCHRVIRSSGALGKKFSAGGGLDLKRKMLELEGSF